MNAVFLSDIFFLLGAAALLFSGFRFAAGQGAFNGIAYALKVAFFKERASYGEYLKKREVKRERPKSRSIGRGVLIGATCLLLSSLILLRGS
ncbi:MAG: DUF3899 domain-containing protein [Clostridia bacterium]|nr:DUF3899 domain-containing protein [Clostridia bacterium]